MEAQPETWIHMAQVDWVRKNRTDQIPSYSDGGPNDSETQNKIIEAIQQEQNRVHEHNQDFFKALAAKKVKQDEEEEDDAVQ